MATVVIQIVRGMMPLVTASDDEAAAALVEELHRLLTSYLRTAAGSAGHGHSAV